MSCSWLYLLFWVCWLAVCYHMLFTRQMHSLAICRRWDVYDGGFIWIEKQMIELKEHRNHFADVSFPLFHFRWPYFLPARPASSATCPAPTQAASVHHVPESKLTGQSEEPEPAAISRPGDRLAEYGGMRPAAGQLGPGQQCGPGEQVRDPDGLQQRGIFISRCYHEATSADSENCCLKCSFWCHVS